MNTVFTPELHKTLLLLQPKLLRCSRALQPEHCVSDVSSSSKPDCDNTRCPGGKGPEPEVFGAGDAAGADHTNSARGVNSPPVWAAGIQSRGSANLSDPGGAGDKDRSSLHLLILKRTSHPAVRPGWHSPTAFSRTAQVKLKAGSDCVAGK